MKRVYFFLSLRYNECILTVVAEFPTILQKRKNVCFLCHFINYWLNLRTLRMFRHIIFSELETTKEEKIS